MRKLVIQDFDDRLATYHPTIRTAADVRTLNLSPEHTEAIVAILPEVEKEIAAGFKPKAIIDFKTGDVYVEYFPIALLMEKLGLRPGPAGVSCCVQAEDGDVLGLKRALTNKTCPGFLGPVAGYVTAKDQSARTIGELISTEITEQMRHEIGLYPDEFTVEVIGVVNVDYPIVQSEVIVLVKTTLDKSTITARAQAKKDEGPGKIAENDVRWLSMKLLEQLFNEPELHIATAHAFALALPIYVDAQGANFGSPKYDEWYFMESTIHFHPIHSKTGAWDGLDELLRIVRHRLGC